jgi:hypothetical protein
MKHRLKALETKVAQDGMSISAEARPGISAQ